MWLTYKVDVTQAAEIAEMVDDLNKHQGRVDILVNNAGITQRAKVIDMSEADWDPVLAVNLKGTFLFTKALLPGLIATDIRGGLESPEEQTRMSVDIPCRRMGTAEEVAAAVCFLASDEAANITGEEIDINGGSHMD